VRHTVYLARKHKTKTHENKKTQDENT